VDKNSDGTVTGTKTYYPFGEARFSTSLMLTDKLFTGQREMTGLGIYHYGARFYSPKLGRFLSADTINLNPANPQKLNHFSYGANNPLRYTDPTGHRACDNVDEAGRCITEPGGGGSGFGGLHPKPPKHGGERGGTCEEGNYSPHCPGWHFYTTTNLVCPAYDNCTEEEMKDWFLRFVYPGQDPSEPVVDEHRYSVSFCINDRCVPMGPYGAIEVEVVDDFTTVNTTLSTHILYNGRVVRHLYQGEDGAWYVSSYGYGNNTVVDALPPDAVPGPDSTVSVSMAPPNQLLGPYIFNNGDYQMFQTILLNH
jgi:RHS repeat-associated protein